MVQLRILSGKQAGCECAVRRFPFQIGRAAENDLRLDDDGIWERHVALTFDPADGFVLRAEPDALVSVNHQPLRTATVRLRNGDCIQLGGATLQFWLAPLTQRSHRWREILLWALVALVTLAQLALIARLLD